MRILLAIDDSSLAQLATRSVIDWIKPDDAEVLVLTVVDLMNYFASEKAAEAYIPNITEVRLSRLEHASALVERDVGLLQAAGFRAAAGVSEGDAKARIVEKAKDWGADLIVVGSHGRKGFEPALLGSVSEAVALNAPCSVVIVRIRSGL